MMKTDSSGHTVMPMVHMNERHYKMQVGNLPTDMGGPLSSAKAREILHDGTVHGKPITDRQRRYFGAVASGKARKK
mgnify:CR=1 FL=1